MKIFLGGSELFFQKYDDYIFHDSDCNIIDEEGEFITNDEMFKHVFVKNGKICEYDVDKYEFKIYSDVESAPYKKIIENGVYNDLYIYKKFNSKNEFIDYIIDNHDKKTHNLNVATVLSPHIQKYYKITVNDIKKIWDNGIFDRLPAGNRWIYYRTMARYVIENDSLQLTDKQHKHVYLIYKLYRKRYNKKFDEFIEN